MYNVMSDESLPQGLFSPSKSNYCYQFTLRALIHASSNFRSGISLQQNLMLTLFSFLASFYFPAENPLTQSALLLLIIPGFVIHIIPNSKKIKSKYFDQIKTQNTLK